MFQDGDFRDLRRLGEFLHGGTARERRSVHRDLCQRQQRNMPSTAGGNSLSTTGGIYVTGAGDVTINAAVDGTGGISHTGTGTFVS